MKHIIKTLNKIFFISAFLVLSVNFSHALDVCPGQGATLIWNATGTITSCGTQSSFGPNGSLCGFSGNNGSKPIVMPGNSGECSVSFQCQNGTVLSNLGSASLSVVNREGCCNTGSQVGLTVWNQALGTCVAPASVTWTDYCVPISEANGNVGYTWQVSNATPPAYREKAPKTACNPCPSGQTWNNQSGAAAVCAVVAGSCTNGATNFSACDACPAGREFNSAVPPVCAPTQTGSCPNGLPIGTYPSCTCPADRYLNNDVFVTCELRTTCPNGLPGSYRPSCACPTGQSIQGGVCTNVVTCPAAARDSNGVCRCSGSDRWTGVSCVETVCVLPFVMTLNPFTGVSACSLPCTSPRSIDAGGSCVCPNGDDFVFPDQCVPALPRPYVSGSPSPCVIAVGASTCTTNLTWDTLNTVGSVRDENMGTELYDAANDNFDNYLEDVYGFDSNWNYVLLEQRFVNPPNVAYVAYGGTAFRR